MNVTKIIDAFGYVIYAALALLAVWGVYNGILLYRGLIKKSIKDPALLIDQVRDLCQARRFDSAINLCQSPPYWHTALAQLIAVALRNRAKGLAKIKQLVVTEFHSEVIAGMENRLGSISTIVRMGPLLGAGGNGRQYDRRVQSHRRLREGGSPCSGHRYQPGALGDRCRALDRQPHDAHRQRRSCAAARLRDRTERQLQDFLEVLETNQT